MLLKIIFIDLLAIGIGVIIGSLLTRETLLLYLLSSSLLVAALFLRWLKAWERFWEKRLEEER